MIIDTSSVLAIFLGESEGESFLDLILKSEQPKMSAGNYLELCLKTDRGADESAKQAFDEFFQKMQIEIVPVSVQQIHIARKANQVYGKGSGHKAKLNFGDCIAYALAKDENLPLLFKGNDFVHTDLELM